MKISTILATKGSAVITIRPERTLKEAALTLAQHNIGAMVVADEAETVVGIFSERDLARAAARADDFLRQTVGEVMTKRVVCGSPQDDVMSVVQTMTARRFRHLPILDHGKLAGMVSIGDMVKAMMQEYQGEIETLESQITES
jgi:CBS domain-containing protein